MTATTLTLPTSHVRGRLGFGQFLALVIILLLLIWTAAHF